MQEAAGCEAAATAAADGPSMDTPASSPAAKSARLYSPAAAPAAAAATQPEEDSQVMPEDAEQLLANAVAAAEAADGATAEASPSAGADPEPTMPQPTQGASGAPHAQQRPAQQTQQQQQQPPTPTPSPLAAATAAAEGPDLRAERTGGSVQLGKHAQLNERSHERCRLYFRGLSICLWELQSRGCKPLANLELANYWGSRRVWAFHGTQKMEVARVIHRGELMWILCMQDMGEPIQRELDAACSRVGLDPGEAPYHVGVGETSHDEEGSLELGPLRPLRPPAHGAGQGKGNRKHGGAQEESDPRKVGEEAGGEEGPGPTGQKVGSRAKGPAGPGDPGQPAPAPGGLPPRPGRKANKKVQKDHPGGPNGRVDAKAKKAAAGAASASRSQESSMGGDSLLPRSKSSVPA